ncbi:putative Calcium-binding site [Heracleum sosnowskyi]|uniref:Calcium-binding site n=1 Tax=Heracleum sosnowskyi TaxID=360622 RepID=A0AAD8JLT8_9APIA|nr:putative Calcium-binding site [Heracleum sosnowskyi]
MKREDRQHSWVRSFCIIPSPLNPNHHPRVINKFDSPTTAGLFTKVTSKPTNHSKFTGRCGKPKCSECHAQLACKSKDKAKGSLKLKSTTDVSTDCKYMSWQVKDQTTNETQKSFEYSASGILDRLANSYDDFSDYDDDDEYDEDVHIKSDKYDYEDWFFVQDNYVSAT